MNQRFYAGGPALYLTGRFYIENFGAYSLACNNKSAHEGKIYANLISS